MLPKLAAAFSINPIQNPQIQTLNSLLQFTASISTLKVTWRKDPRLDQAIENDKHWRLCARLAREVLNEPGRAIPLRYLAKRRDRLGLPVTVHTFLARNPGLFDTYTDRIRPKSDPVPFLRPSHRLTRFLDEEKSIYARNEPLIVSKLCKLLMMAKDRVLSASKLVEAKRDFGFPDDFLVSVVAKYPEYFKLYGTPGEGPSFVELVHWEDELAKSVIERRAEEESRLLGFRVRPAFVWKLPSGFYIKKEMREWVRDWMELPYVSPYEDVLSLDPASREMEKRMVGVFHELLSLSVYKRVAVDTLGKFCEDYRFSNSFSSVFTRHSGIFYMSLKGGIRTAMLREAYSGEEIVDRDPILEVRDKFVQLLDDGRKERDEKMRLREEKIHKDLELAAVKNEEFEVNNKQDLES